MVISYRPGFVEMLPLSTYDSGITTTLTTKPESIPRKIRILTQDHDEKAASTEDLVNKLGAHERFYMSGNVPRDLSDSC